MEREIEHKDERREVQMHPKAKNVIVSRGRPSTLQSSMYQKNSRGLRQIKDTWQQVSQIWSLGY